MVALYVIKLDSTIIKELLTGADGSIICDQVGLDYELFSQEMKCTVCDHVRLDQKLFTKVLVVALYVIKLDSIINKLLTDADGSIGCDQVRLDHELSQRRRW